MSGVSAPGGREGLQPFRSTGAKCLGGTKFQTGTWRINHDSHTVDAVPRSRLDTSQPKVQAAARRYGGNIGGHGIHGGDADVSQALAPCSLRNSSSVWKASFSCSPPVLVTIFFKSIIWLLICSAGRKSTRVAKMLASITACLARLKPMKSRKRWV